MNAPMRPPDRYIEGAAVVSGGPAWLMSRILRSPDVRRVLTHPPAWVERGDLTATVMAIDLAARAFETALTAPERGNEAPLGAVTAQSELTTREAANHLGMSQRRVQELAAALGGRRVGREWRLPEVAVREYEKQAGKRTGGCARQEYQRQHPEWTTANNAGKRTAS